MPTNLTRRRFISVVGATAGVAISPFAAWANPKLVQWRGQALGAEATIKLHTDNPARAAKVLEFCGREIGRLERIFSLYDESSEICRLNRDGNLHDASKEMINLLLVAEQVSEKTKGAFDATVQPLWQLYRRHFSAPDANPKGPGMEEVVAACRLVNWRKVSISGNDIAFAANNMGITLNGIAQGYITDHIADLLKDHGIENVYVDLGEIRPIGVNDHGRPWRIGVADPRTSEGLLEVLEMTGKAVASSGGRSTPLNGSGTVHHLFDPRSGAAARHWAGVTVIAKNATMADALSTAFAVSTRAEIQLGLQEWVDVEVILVDHDGAVNRISA